MTRSLRMRQTLGVAVGIQNSRNKEESVNNKMSPIEHLNQRLKDEFELLLKTAHPRPLKKRQIASILKDEVQGLSIRELESKVHDFFSIAYERRTEKQVARTFQIKPYPWLMQQFVLNFASAGVSETAMIKSAGRFRYLFRTVIAPPEEINSISFLHTVIHRISNPNWNQPTTGIDLSVFANVWQKSTWERYGEKHRLFFSGLFEKLEDTPQQSFLQLDLFASGESNDHTFELNLTQTDLDWMKDLIDAINLGERLPAFPLQRGPVSATSQRMEKLVRAANKIYPKHHLALEETLQRACLDCLKSYHQVPEDENLNQPKGEECGVQAKALKVDFSLQDLSSDR